MCIIGVTLKRLTYELILNFMHLQNIYILLFLFFYRQEVIERLQNQHSVVILVTNSLTNYMEKVRQLCKDNPNSIDPNTYTPDNRYNHIVQVHERLNFLRFLLKVKLINHVLYCF